MAPTTAEIDRGRPRFDPSAQLNLGAGCVDSDGQVYAARPPTNYAALPPEEDIDGISNLNCKAPSLSLSPYVENCLALPASLPASCHADCGDEDQSAYSAPFARRFPLDKLVRVLAPISRQVACFQSVLCHRNFAQRTWATSSPVPTNIWLNSKIWFKAGAKNEQRDSCDSTA